MGSAGTRRALPVRHGRNPADDPSNAPEGGRAGALLARSAADWLRPGLRHPARDLAQRLHGRGNLGRVLKGQGDLAGARAAYERALAIDETAFGPDHPNVAIRVNNLGSVLRAEGDLAGARAAYERALAIFEKVLGSDHPNTVIARGNLDRLNRL